MHFKEKRGRGSRRKFTEQGTVVPYRLSKTLLYFRGI